MSDATLQFLPWMRRGLARVLAEEADETGRPLVDAGTVEAGVTLAEGTADEIEVTHSTRVQGPGHVTGLNTAVIVRQTPPAGAVDFEANYFPAIEFSAPDLPWLFTPAAPNGTTGRLAPWMVLIAVPDSEDSWIEQAGAGPLPVLHMEGGLEDALFDLSESWAWAHVQASAERGTDLTKHWERHPEAFVARCISPSRLVENTWYTACLVPAFRSGVQAGMGDEVTATAPEPAWDINGLPSVLRLPVYTHWRFKTALETGDFENLVRRLKPRTLDPSVGVKELDVGNPIDDPTAAFPPYMPGTLVSYQGALTAPESDTLPWKNPHRKAFQEGMREELNTQLEANSASTSGSSYEPLRDDPILGPPAYGTFPSAISEIAPAGTPASVDTPLWLGETNLDPVHRSTAGLGAEVVRRNQERLMASAWDQAVGLREVNRVLNRTRLALEASSVLKVRVDTLPTDTRLQMTRGAHPRLFDAAAGSTVRGLLTRSSLPDGLVSAAFRSRTRPSTTLGKATLESGNTKNPTAAITSRFFPDPTDMLVYAAWVQPDGIAFEDSDSDVADEATGTPTIDKIESVTDALGQRPPNIELPELEPIPGELSDRPNLSWETQLDAGPLQEVELGSRPTEVELDSGLPRRRRANGRWVEDVEPVAGGGGGEPGGAGGSRGGPGRVGGRRGEPSRAGGRRARRGPRGGSPRLGRRATPLPELSESVLTPGYTVITGVAADAELADLDDVVREALDPAALLSTRVRSLIKAPATAWSSAAVPAAMTFEPTFEQAMSPWIVDIDADFLMPGAKDLRSDTVALAKVNAPFMEAFLLGANHELAREFMWREYPTPLNGTWLRRFWESLPQPGETDPIEDIGPVSGWATKGLGTHLTGFDPDKVLVLIVKSDLLRRYPDTFIYAVPGEWREIEQDDGSTVWERREDASATPLFPVFTGSLGSDLTFLGFEFSVDLEAEVKGTSDRSDGTPGWYFVFEQPTTQPRFGLDVGRQRQVGRDPKKRPQEWSDLSWYHQVEEGGALEDVDHAEALGRFRDVEKPYDDEGANAGVPLVWGSDAAQMAFITLQRPVRMLVHADQMLESEEDSEPAGGS